MHAVRAVARAVMPPAWSRPSGPGPVSPPRSPAGPRRSAG
jgi:hypothetical protein